MACPFGTGPGLSPRGRGNRRRHQHVGANLGTIPARAGEPSHIERRTLLRRDYPRAGGGTFLRFALLARLAGLSPRGRGNPRDGGALGGGQGTIPARAGEPPPRDASAAGCRDYPRAGGGTLVRSPAISVGVGLSPRGRGNHRPEIGGPLAVGTIPARAGEPWNAWRPCSAPGDYPRAGGGTLLPVLRAIPHAGLSPRGRGNRGRSGRRGNPLGTIPARAGEPAAPAPDGSPPGDYPRAGGGTTAADRANILREGLSPRGRGNLVRRGLRGVRGGTIPARAGEPPSCGRSGT